MVTYFPSTLTPGATSSEAASYIMALFGHATADIDVAGVRFYSPAGQTGTAVGLYEAGQATGVPIAQKAQDFSTGWNEVLFDAPVAITAGGDYFFAVLLPGPTVHYTALTAGVTDNFAETGWVAVKPGQFHSPASSLTLSAPPHIGGTADGGQFADTGTPTWYGVQVVTGSATPPAALDFTATRVDDTHVSVAWDDADPTITDGISVVRAAGDQSATLDGAGIAPGAEGYDPTTIAGASVLAENVLVTPYADTVPSAGAYTYWINRSAGA